MQSNEPGHIISNHRGMGAIYNGQIVVIILGCAMSPETTNPPLLSIRLQRNIDSWRRIDCSRLKALKISSSLIRPMQRRFVLQPGL